MRSTPIRAIDTIVIHAPCPVVWGALVDVGGYPQWWPASLRLRVLSVHKELLGTEIEMRPFGGRPFRCRIEHVEELTCIRTRYFGGFIEGVGEWRVEPEEKGTRVTYKLDAVAHGRLVAWLGRIIDLSRLHSKPMRQLLRNLEGTVLQRLGAPLPHKNG